MNMVAEVASLLGKLTVVSAKKKWVAKCRVAKCRGGRRLAGKATNH
jgi:hypothetical protein